MLDAHLGAILGTLVKAYDKDVLLREHAKVSELITNSMANLNLALDPLGDGGGSGPVARNVVKHLQTNSGSLAVALRIALLAKRSAEIEMRLWGLDPGGDVDARIKEIQDAIKEADVEEAASATKTPQRLVPQEPA